MALNAQVSEALSNALPNALQTCVAEHDADRMITRQLVIFESITGDGERTLSFFPGPEMRAWDVLGYIDYVKTITDEWIKNEGM